MGGAVASGSAFAVLASAGAAIIYGMTHMDSPDSEDELLNTTLGTQCTADDR